MKIAITGAAGFIGFHVARAMLAAGHAVSGMDAFAGHDPALARQRLALLLEHPEFDFVELDLVEAADLQDWLARAAPDVVLHLAAEAGAGRPSPTRARMSAPTWSAPSTCWRRAGARHRRTS